MIGAIVLAAGSSRRFGYADKLLAPLHGVPLLAHSLRTVMKSRLHPIIVVTGPGQRRIARLCRQEIGSRSGLRLAHNRYRNHGMAQSLHTGIRALPPACHAVFVCLGDMPGIDHRILRRLARSWRPGLDAIRPVHRNQPGHPVLLSRALFPSLRGVTGDHGAQGVIRKIPSARRRFLPAPSGCIVDIDTPRALRNIRRRSGYEKRRAPAPA